MSGPSIFRRPYVVRRYGAQTITDGYAGAAYTDIVTQLNVQPLSPDEMQALPEGERQFKRLKAFGDLQLTASDQFTGTPGDWLYYFDRWYKCVSSVPWNHTMLGHCRSEFSEVGEADGNLDRPELEDEL